MLKDLLSNRYTAKWWSDDSVDSEKLQYILDCTYLSPSKQGKWNYEIFVLGNNQKSISIKEWLYWENTYCLDTVRGKEGPIGNRRYNGQITAPIVLVWVAKDRDNEIFNDCMVSSTIAMMAAQEQGLQTGFNACQGQKDLAKKLDREGSYAYISLGLGNIDKIDGIDNSIQREVIKDNVKHGFDYGNVDVSVTRGPNRYNKPKIDALIKHI